MPGNLPCHWTYCPAQAPSEDDGAFPHCHRSDWASWLPGVLGRPAARSPGGDGDDVCWYCSAGCSGTCSGTLRGASAMQTDWDGGLRCRSYCRSLPCPLMGPVAWSYQTLRLIVQDMRNYLSSFWILRIIFYFSFECLPSSSSKVYSPETEERKNNVNITLKLTDESESQPGTFIRTWHSQPMSSWSFYWYEIIMRKK